MKSYVYNCNVVNEVSIQFGMLDVQLLAYQNRSKLIIIKESLLWPTQEYGR